MIKLIKTRGVELGTRDVVGEVLAESLRSDAQHLLEVKHGVSHVPVTQCLEVKAEISETQGHPC